MSKRIVRGADEVRKVEVQMSPHQDAAEWMIGACHWRMQRVSAKWELYRVGADVEVMEGRFRAFDDAVAYSLGWCRGLISSQFALNAVVEATLGVELVRAEMEAPDKGKGVPDADK